MQVSVIETVAKYFYFSSLDEQLTFAASLKALEDLRSNDWIGNNHRERWVATLTKWKAKLPRMAKRPWSHSLDEKGFTMPKNFDVNAWNSFIHSADPSEWEAVLLSKILKFSDEEIAAGLEVTVGTVRYRVGRGLRHLGGYIES